MAAILRGDLYWADLEPVRGREQAGRRPVLVVSVPFLAHERTLCIVVPHTASLIGTRFDSRSVAIACAPRASDHQSNGTL